VKAVSFVAIASTRFVKAVSFAIASTRI
jgi:hypothetical protein